MATLKDIGHKLDLSITTVSRALNGFPEVSEETRKLVLQTAQAMNYRPNQSARQLATGQPNMVGIIEQAAPNLSTDIQFMEMITGLSQYFAAHELHFILHIGTETDELDSYRYLLSTGTVGGFVLRRPKHNDPRIRFLREQNVPFVVHGRAPDDNDYAYFDIDNYASAYDSTRYLLDLGHRNIVFLNGPANEGFAIARKQGFLDAFRDRKLTPPQEACIQHQTMTEEYGWQAVHDCWQHPEEKPTAFLCALTLIAAGVYRAAHDLGLRIPDDISVLAHDDALPHLRAINFDPKLTVARAPLRDANEPLTELLVRRIKGEAIEQLQQLYQAELIVRQSTGIAPSKQNTEFAVNT